jgi:RHS repeat-associated protein
VPYFNFANHKSYIVYMYFDKSMNVVPTQSGIIQVGEANMLGQLAQSGIVARSDGFFYTYVTNRSEGAVFFDNLSIKHWAPMVRVTYDYYPYGLTWENPKLPTDPNAVHDHAYQGKEFQFAEFTTGHGLALYDFHARMYDPATARWLVPDPAAQFANPYLAMGNNPVAFVDPDGQLAFIVPVIIGAVAGGFIGGAIQQGDGGLSGANWNVGSWDNTAWQGITVGAIVGAGVGLAVSSGLAMAKDPIITGISKGLNGFSRLGATTWGVGHSFQFFNDSKYQYGFQGFARRWRLEKYRCEWLNWIGCWCHWRCFWCCA